MTNKLLSGFAVLVCAFLAHYFWVSPAKVVSGAQQQETDRLDASPSSARPPRPSAQQQTDNHSSPKVGVVGAATTTVPETMLSDTAAVLAKAKTMDEVFDIYSSVGWADPRKFCAVTTVFTGCNNTSDEHMRIVASPDSVHAGVLRDFHRRYCQRTKARSVYQGGMPISGIGLPSPNAVAKLATYTSEFINNGQESSNTEAKLALRRHIAEAMHSSYCDVDLTVDAFSRLEKANYREHLDMVTHLKSLGPEELPLVFRLASRMAACKGGSPACAPGGLLTINFCMQRIMCTPSLSLMEAYRLTHSPLVYESAMQIADFYATYPTQGVVAR
jgi:hypothetical protein